MAPFHGEFKRDPQGTLLLHLLLHSRNSRLVDCVLQRPISIPALRLFLTLQRLIASLNLLSIRRFLQQAGWRPPHHESSRSHPEQAHSGNPGEKSWCTVTNLVAEHWVKRGGGDILRTAFCCWVQFSLRCWSGKESSERYSRRNSATGLIRVTA